MTPGPGIDTANAAPREGLGEASSTPWFVWWALAGPGVMWLAVAAAVLIASCGGYRALAAPADLTLAEAAAIRDEADVLKQIWADVDPNGRYRVRRGMISDPEYLMTPLEAATAARQVDVFRLLLRNGAALNATNFPVLFCLAQEKDALDIASVLTENIPPGIAFECKDVRLPL